MWTGAVRAVKIAALKHHDDEIEPEIVQLIEQTVREGMAHYPLRAVKVRAGEDHCGNPVIFVAPEYDLVDHPIELMGTFELMNTLSDKLLASGERRFPHIRHMFDERQRFKKRRRAKT